MDISLCHPLYFLDKLLGFFFIEAVLKGQPVLSGQLAIPQRWPRNTDLTVFNIFNICQIN